MQETEWDADLVRAWLFEAADTLARLPSGLAREKLTSWPLVDSQASYSWRPNPPNAAAIDRMDKVLQWLRHCPNDERRILWARVNGFSWRRIAQLDGRSHTQMKILEIRAIDRILKALNAGTVNWPRVVPRGLARAPILNRRRIGNRKQA